MVASEIKVQIQVKFAWWFTWLYLPIMKSGFYISENLFGVSAELNDAKLRCVIDRALRAKII